jgi:molybdopterin synthase sulfur carrier subunit
MSVRILFFASLREKLGVSAEEVPLPEGVDTVGKLRAFLAQRPGAWASISSDTRLRAAVNQRMADGGTPVGEGDEVAFFPPVTGG